MDILIPGSTGIQTSTRVRVKRGRMFFRQKVRFGISLIAVLTAALTAYPGRAADDHVLTSSDLNTVIQKASQARENDLAKVRKFFSSEPAAHTLQNFRLDPVKVESAISQLDDRELARLAARTEQLQNDLAAGALNNQQITYILIALATAVIVLIIVER